MFFGAESPSFSIFYALHGPMEAGMWKVFFKFLGCSNRLCLSSFKGTVSRKITGVKCGIN